MKKSAIIRTLIGVISIFILSCETTIETYEQFTMNGEEILLGKPLSIVVNPGNQRAEFVVELNADPKINSVNITWTEPDGTVRSHDIDYVRKNDGQDKLTFTLDDISEGPRAFIFTTKGDSGLTSLKVEVNQNIYGPIYQSGLIPRSVTSIVGFYEFVKLNLTSNFPSNIESTEIEYEDASGRTQEIVIDNATTSVDITAYNRDKKIAVRSLFKPVSNAIDTFESIITYEIAFPESFTLDRSLWKLVSLNNDLPPSISVWPPINDLDFAWDGDSGTWGSHIGPMKPVHFTVDLGIEPIRLKQFSWSGFPLNRNEEIKDYQIWGITDISKSDTSIDAGTDLVGFEAEMVNKGWIKLLEGSRPQSDDGYTTDITNEAKVKFLRIVPLNNQLGSGNMIWGDFSFTAYY